MRIFWLLSILVFVACSGVRPDGEEEAVLIKKPWFAGHGGVVKEPVASGLTWVALTTSAIKFKITPVTHTEEFSNMMTKDNTPIDFAAYLKLQVRKGESPYLYEKFGQAWYENSIAPTFRALVRDKASSYKMFDLASNREVLKEVELYLFNEIKNYCDKLKLPVEVLQVTIGAVTPPQAVLNETRNTAAQNQSILTQTARANAETARKQAEINKAIADKAYQNEMKMSTAEYLQLRSLEIEKEKIEIVRDNKNATIIMGQGIVPTFQAK